MRVEVGCVWLNWTPLSFRQLRARAVRVDFWDYTCLNCRRRTLPYVQAWHERYQGKGLTVIGVHPPEFTFAEYESNVELGVREFELIYSGQLEEGCFYASGRWGSTAEYLESGGDNEHRIALKYSAAAVNLVMASQSTPAWEVIIRQDGSLASRPPPTPVRLL